MLLSQRLRRLLSLDGFAVAPIWAQLSLLIILSTSLILLFRSVLDRLSFDLFFSPTVFYDLVTGSGSTWYRIAAGLFLMIVGVCIGGFIVSILSAALSNFIDRVRKGVLPYRNKAGHILIVNTNSKLPHILDEINTKMESLRRSQSVVVLLKDSDAVQALNTGLVRDKTPYLNIYLRQGDLFQFETYERLSVLDAQGLLLLLDEDIKDPFQADNVNLKLLSLLTREDRLRQMLVRRMESLSPFKFAIELTDTGIARDIATSLAEIDGKQMIAIVSRDVIFRVLTRSLVDLAYYKIYYEILSYFGSELYFVDPRRFGNLTGKTFDSLHLGFNRGILIGRTRVVRGSFELELGPGKAPLAQGEWLIFIAPSAEEIVWDPSMQLSPAASRVVKEPSEIVSKRICIIGDENAFPNIGDFLDQESRELLERNRVLRANVQEYFDRDLIMRIREQDFDGVIINLEDEVAFRLTLYILSLFGKEDPFLSRIITVIENPISEDLLNRNIKYRNTILSNKLAAKYMTQLAYQRSLELLIHDLMEPEGYEFNLLEVEKDIPRSFLTTKKEVKETLMANGMIYVGTIDQERSARFDSERFEGVRQVIVLARGVM